MVEGLHYFWYFLQSVASLTVSAFLAVESFLIRNLFAFILVAGFLVTCDAQTGRLMSNALMAAGAGGDPAPSYSSIVTPDWHTGSSLLTTTTLPRLAPQLALQVYQFRVSRQSAQLSAYSATTTIHADLPDTHQHGEFVLNRQFRAPKTLQFTPVHFAGDNFVKSNVITRLLQSEVDQLQKDQPGQIAINDQNYKMSYKGSDCVSGRLVHVFQVKPRHKRPGLFKGRIFLDSFTGSIVRAEGRMVKSPSMFVKNINFVQDYADVGSFTFPTSIRSEAKTRLIGRVMVNMSHRDWRPEIASSIQQAQNSSQRNPLAAHSN